MAADAPGLPDKEAIGQSTGPAANTAAMLADSGQRGRTNTEPCLRLQAPVDSHRRSAHESPPCPPRARQQGRPR
jgi:hypothetical protein